VGIINNSGGYLYSITLSTVGGSGADIFGFDGDGPCNYAQFSNSLYDETESAADCFNYPAGVLTNGNPGLDPYDYQGPNNTFSNYGSLTTGTVNFITPIPNGGSTWFALEGPPSSLSGVTVSNTLTVTELGTGTGTVTDNQSQINCGESNGYPLSGSTTCTTSYSSSLGTVTLTANPYTTPSNSNPFNPYGSAFLQWGGACNSTNSNAPPTAAPYQCTLPVTSAQSVTADFIPIPTAIPFTLSGTNAIADAVYACPSGTSPCTDTNAYGMSLQFPAVSSTFGQPPLYIVATEVYADGLCPPGGTIPTSETTLVDFDCRFASFWNYGTDNAGNTVVPLCDAYANGNCVHFDVYYGSFGNEPPITSYTGPVFETFSFTNSTFSPGSYWAGSTTRAIADPDADEITPSVPWGTDCESPMYTEGSQTPPAINCQFDADVTAFIDTGGKTNQANDFVVAFQPSLTGAPIPNPNSALPPPALVAPTIFGTCINGCTDPPGTIAFTEGTGGTFEVSVPAPLSPTPYPAPNLTASTTGTTTTASETGGTVTLMTSTGSFGSQSVGGDTVVVSGCSVAGYNGTFPIASIGSGTLTYSDSAASGTPTGCNALVLPNGLLYNGSTGVVSGTPADGTTGSYPITFTAANGVPPNATLSYNLTVSPATLNISASASTTYGATTPPVITTTVTGLVNGDLASIVSCSSAVTSSSPAGGSYPISCTVSASSTYNVSCTTACGYVTVNRAPLTITASSATMIYGASPPTISPTFTFNGLVNNDTALTLGVTCSTTATSTSLPGTYPSSCTASNGGNYTITPVNGKVTVLGLDISPLIVNFGPLYLGQIGVQFVTLKNTTTAPITINSITHGGGSADGDFGDLTFCPPMILKLPAQLPAGKICAVGVGILATAKVFSPYPSTTYLTITDSAATQQVLLTAQVTDPLVSLSSTSLSFGSQKTGTTSTPPKEVTLTNAGATPLALTGLKISPTANFALTSGAGTNCTSLPTLSPGGTCAIYVTFTPTTKGAKYSGSVTITDHTLSGTQTISLSGTGD